MFLLKLILSNTQTLLTVIIFLEFYLKCFFFFIKCYDITVWITRPCNIAENILCLHITLTCIFLKDKNGVQSVLKRRGTSFSCHKKAMDTE